MPEPKNFKTDQPVADADSAAMQREENEERADFSEHEQKAGLVAGDIAGTDAVEQTGGAGTGSGLPTGSSTRGGIDSPGAHRTKEEHSKGDEESSD